LQACNEELDLTGEVGRELRNELEVDLTLAVTSLSLFIELFCSCFSLERVILNFGSESFELSLFTLSAYSI
jgi:hypothetical protein